MGRPAHLTPNFKLNKLRSGYWEIRWTEAGRTKFKSTRTKDPEEAKQALARHKVDYYSPKASEDPLLSHLIAAYRKDHLPLIASPASQRYALDKIEAFFAAHRPAEITDQRLREYASWRKAQTRWGRSDSGGVGDGTVAREVNALRAVLSWASRNRLVKESVDVRLPVRLPPGRDRYLTWDEVSRLLKVAKKTPHLELFIRLALATAARKSAILELQWSQVTWPEDPDPLKWRLAPGDEYEYEQLGDGLMIDLGRGVGNKRRSKVPIGDNAPLYRALRRAQRDAKTSFVIEFRGQPIKDVKTALAHACEEAAVRECTPHVLKHTSISWMVKKGVPFGVITKITGTSTATLERHYSHLSPEMAAQLGDMFSL